MKRLALTCIIAVAALTGCATSTYTMGNDFASANVASIVKGTTTEADLLRMFGQPYTKSVLSDTQSLWVYMHLAGTAHAQAMLLSTSVQSTSTTKQLEVFMTNGIVTNYTFTDSPLSGNTTTR